MEVIIKVTSNCNFSCNYCMEKCKGNNVLSDENLGLFCSQLPDLIRHINDDRIHVILHGGEPLSLPDDKIINIISIIETYLHNIDYNVGVQTNGFNLSEKLLNFSKSHNIRYSISLDGYKELHDKNRRTLDGHPTFDRVLSNIKRLKESRLLSGIMMVMDTDESIDIKQLYRIISDYSLDIKINPVIKVSNINNQEDTLKNYHKYYQMLINLFEYASKHNARFNLEPLNQLFDAILLGKELKTCAYNGLCASKTICLNCNGVVGVCGRFDNTDIKYGVISKDNLIQLFNHQAAMIIRERSKILYSKECSGCDVWNYCHGGCTYEAYIKNHNFNDRFIFCEEYKSFIKYLKTKGLSILKQRLIFEKKVLQNVIREKKEILKDVTKNAK